MSYIVLPESLVSVFTADPGVIHDASLYLRAAGVAQLAMALENVLEGGHGRRAGYRRGLQLYTMLAVVSISALRVPLAGLAADAFGLAGIW